MHPFHRHGLSGPRESELIADCYLFEFYFEHEIYPSFDFQNCKLLEKMDLEECLLITDATLTHLAMGCPRLEKLVSITIRYISVHLDRRQNACLAFARFIEPRIVIESLDNGNIWISYLPFLHAEFVAL